jgi:spore coat polysaccharide biosynthesis predicted glycosyltransferase SpsG
MGNGMSVEFAIFAEANGEIGSGHLVEAQHIAQSADEAGMTAQIIVPRTVPNEFLAIIGRPVQLLEDFEPSQLKIAGRHLVQQGVQAAILNLRNASNEQVLALSSSGLLVLCIDELGGRHLDCNVVINTMPAASRHQYTSANKRFKLYSGPRFMALSSDYRDLALKPRLMNGGIASVVISMGGVDRTGTTLRIVDALLSWESGAQRHIVIGAGFKRGSDLERLLSGAGTLWTIHRNLPSLATLLASVDVGISAGGNTLLELAAAGTPAIVIPEDLHEKDQGAALESQGFSLLLASGTLFQPEKLRDALNQLENPALRQQQSDSGKRLVDGRGASRIISILKEQFSFDPSVSA